MVKLGYPSLDLQIYANPRDQRRAQELLQRFPEIMCKAYERGAMRFAKILLQVVKWSLSTGQPPVGSGVSWPPLGEKTKKVYKSWGFPNTHLWYVIGQLYRRIGIQRSRSRKQELIVGFPQGIRATHPNKKARGNLNLRPTVAALVRMLESGSARVPPRPLFRPAFKSAGGTQRLNKFIVEELKKEIRKHI